MFCQIAGGFHSQQQLQESSKKTTGASGDIPSVQKSQTDCEMLNEKLPVKESSLWLSHPWSGACWFLEKNLGHKPSMKAQLQIQWKWHLEVVAAGIKEIIGVYLLLDTECQINEGWMMCWIYQKNSESSPWKISDHEWVQSHYCHGFIARPWAVAVVMMLLCFQVISALHILYCNPNINPMKSASIVVLKLQMKFQVWCLLLGLLPHQNRPHWPCLAVAGMLWGVAGGLGPPCKFPRMPHGYATPGALWEMQRGRGLPDSAACQVCVRRRRAQQAST